MSDIFSELGDIFAAYAFGSAKPKEPKFPKKPPPEAKPHTGAPSKPPRGPQVLVDRKLPRHIEKGGLLHPALKMTAETLGLSSLGSADQLRRKIAKFPGGQKALANLPALQEQLRSAATEKYTEWSEPVLPDEHISQMLAKSKMHPSHKAAFTAAISGLSYDRIAAMKTPEGQPYVGRKEDPRFDTSGAGVSHATVAKYVHAAFKQLKDENPGELDDYPTVGTFIAEMRVKATDNFAKQNLGEAFTESNLHEYDDYEEALVESDKELAQERQFKQEMAAKYGQQLGLDQDAIREGIERASESELLDRRRRAGAGQAGEVQGGAGLVDLFKEAGRRGVMAEKTYPIAPRDEWYGDADFQQRGGQLVEMSPDEYLAQVRPLRIDETSRDSIDDLKRHIQSGKTLDPLAIYSDGKEDGRHRAVAAKELGISKVPVIVFPRVEGFAKDDVFAVYAMGPIVSALGVQGRTDDVFRYIVPPVGPAPKPPEKPAAPKPAKPPHPLGPHGKYYDALKSVGVNVPKIEWEKLPQGMSGDTWQKGGGYSIYTDRQKPGDGDKRPSWLGDDKGFISEHGSVEEAKHAAERHMLQTVADSLHMDLSDLVPDEDRDEDMIQGFAKEGDLDIFAAPAWSHRARSSFAPKPPKEPSEPKLPSAVERAVSMGQGNKEAVESLFPESLPKPKKEPEWPMVAGNPRTAMPRKETTGLPAIKATGNPPALQPARSEPTSLPATKLGGVELPKPKPPKPMRQMGLHAEPDRIQDAWWHDTPHTNWLRNGEETGRQRLHASGINGAWKLYLAGDTPLSDYTGLWKARDDDMTAVARPRTIPEGNPHGHEAAAWEVAHLVGLGDMVPPTVVRENKGQIGSVQHFVPGQVAAFNSAHPFGEPGSRQFPLAAAFDALILNTDRHMKNWLMDPQTHKMTLIDHGLSWPNTHDKPIVGTSSILGQALQSGIPVPPEVLEWKEQWPHIERSLKRNGFTDEQIQLTQKRLDALAESASHGKGFRDWLNRSSIGDRYELK